MVGGNPSSSQAKFEQCAKCRRTRNRRSGSSSSSSKGAGVGVVAAAEAEAAAAAAEATGVAAETAATAAAEVAGAAAGSAAEEAAAAAAAAAAVEEAAAAEVAAAAEAVEAVAGSAAEEAVTAAPAGVAGVVEEATVAAAAAAAAAAVTLMSEPDLSGDGCNNTAMGCGPSSTKPFKHVGFTVPSPSHEKKKKSTPNDMDIKVIDPDVSSQLATNTALNSMRFSSAGINEELKTPVWKLSQFAKRHAAVQAIKNPIWKQIKPFQQVYDIKGQLDSPKFQLLWSKFTTDDFSRDLPIAKIKVFVLALYKNKEDWTSSQDTRYVYHRILCALSRTSPEIFGGDWKRTGKLQPSLIISWWTAVIEVLGCFFNLMVQIIMTTKAVLKSDSKGLKVGGKTLTLDIVGKSITKTGRLIKGKVKRLPFATKIRVAQQFSTKYQIYLELQVSGNILGVKNGIILSQSSEGSSTSS